jgi:hypothetical protein
MMNWPLFTYHPGPNEVDLFYARPRPGEGPAMYWYGWTATSMLAAAVLGMLATFLPERVTQKIPLTLVWIVPVLAIPLLFYSLMPSGRAKPPTSNRRRIQFNPDFDASFSAISRGRDRPYERPPARIRT